MKFLPEVSKDFHPVKLLLEDAFNRRQEAALVEVLRVSGRLLGYVAVEAGQVAGFAAYSPVEIEAETPVRALGLGPMAVQKRLRGKGVGTKLLAASLEACRGAGHEAVFVLGDPAFYRRAGFRPASDFGLRCEYDAPPGFFLALELVPGALTRSRGTVRYAPEFAACA